MEVNPVLVFRYDGYWRKEAQAQAARSLWQVLGQLGRSPGLYKWTMSAGIPAGIIIPGMWMMSSGNQQPVPDMSAMGLQPPFGLPDTQLFTQSPPPPRPWKHYIGEGGIRSEFAPDEFHRGIYQLSSPIMGSGILG